MGKRSRRAEFNQQEHNGKHVTELDRIEAKNEAQSHYLISMAGNIITIGQGPAGTGKTFLAASTAVEMLINRKINKIIVTRPAVETGRGLGFLPGKLEEKFDPYLAPVREVFERHLGKGEVECRMKNGSISALPLEIMRGHTFDNAFVIFDEAQNATPEQMKLFLTRIGEWTKVVINGDITQSDIEGLSGLEDVVTRLQGMRDVQICEFTDEDCVRSGIVREVLRRYKD